MTKEGIANSTIDTPKLSVTDLPQILLDHPPLRAARLLPELRPYCQNQFTGRVDLYPSASCRYSLYLNLGNIVWASGGLHPLRRWRRLMNRHCPQALAQLSNLREADRFECWDYHVLTVLVQRGWVTDEQILAIVDDLVAEVLFDFLQALARLSKSQTAASERRYRVQSYLGVRPSETSTSLLRHRWTLELEPVLARGQNDWMQWQKAGFAAWLPDLAPIIADSERLERQVSPATFRQLTTSLNGCNSLRDLAVLAKRDELSVARSLLPYLRQKSLELVKISDLEIPKNPPERASKSFSRGLIVCIDDNPKVRETLDGIISQAGYECLTIGNPLEALPLLIQRKPKLIFLDLTMPTVNGYELCSQIRRLPGFEETPVAILTSNDGLVDRVRAKLVGATGFLSKPVKTDKVLGAIRKYLEQSALGSESN